MSDKLNYILYHCHTDFSLLDSCTKPSAYINRCKELGIKAIAFTEHANMYNWIGKKQACDEAGIKYIHGIEAYLTESLSEKKRDNYHVVLLAKNWEGVKELNELYTMSTDKEHFYYSPRISFDEFLGISDNIISTSACLGGALNKLNQDNPYFQKLLDKFTFLEIQHHADPSQVLYNQMLAKVDRSRLIAGTDTHSIDEYKGECRSIWMKAKGQHYDNENNFDLVFKTYDELVSSYKKQNALSEEIYLEAIDRTNRLYDMVEDFELDKSFKYPNDIYEEPTEMLKNKVYDGINKMYEDGEISEEMFDTYFNRAEEELRIFIKLKMESFMLFMAEIINWCLENDIPVGPARGSAGGSLVGYILNVTDLDAIQWGTVFSRFVNENRVSLGD